MSAHTPGPWNVACESGEWFATLQDYSPIPCTVENARLIAAAPDLLDVLYTVLPYIEDAELDQAYKPGAVAKVTAQVRAAIAKAIGDK